MIPECVPYTSSDMAGRPSQKDAPLFGQKIAALRQDRGFSQEELAKRLGTTRANIAYYERKAENPTLDFVQRCAEVFGVSVSDLIGDQPPKRGKPGPPSKLEIQLEEVRKLPKAKQKFVSEMLDTVLKSSE
jgi:transcriptional regulator with XRE-family HTH domain